VLIHLRPQSYLVECAIQADLVLGPLDEHEVAVTRATDAFVADRFAGNLHWPERRGFEGGRVRATLTLQSMRRVGKSTGHTLGAARPAAEAVCEQMVEAIDPVALIWL